MSKPVKLTLIFAGLALSPHGAAAEICSWQHTAKPDPAIIIDIDKVWSGVRVNFSGAHHGDRFVVGYYDQDRWLTVAEVDPKTRHVVRQRLQTRFAGWDSHNAVALEIDKAGLVHAAANMHADKLKYFRSAAPGMPMKAFAMIDQDVDHVTYPTFLKDTNGNLLFVYRAGSSGNGHWLTNRWDGMQWNRVESTSFLGDRGFGGQVSAYPSRFVLAKDGYFHLAIVWRLSPDAATNVRLSYAKTRDFLTWLDSADRSLKAPLTPESAETVIHTGANAGLLNNTKVSIDGRGHPVIVFTRYDPQGFNTVELASPAQTGWRVSTVATSERRAPVQGTGSLTETVAFSNIDFSSTDRPVLYYRFPGGQGVQQVLQPDTFSVDCTLKPTADSHSKYADRPIATTIPQIQPIGGQAELLWSAQPAHHDRPYECTPSAPQACKPPPSTLKLLLR